MKSVWEYTYKYLSESFPVPDRPEITLVDWDESNSDWNMWARDGWELVQIIPQLDTDGTMRGGVVILKRPIS